MDPNCLQFWDVVGNWAAAASTFLAVLATIYFARRDNTIRMQITAVIGIVVGDPHVSHKEKHLWITVTNLGRREVTVTNVGWRSGLFHHKLPNAGRRYAVQVLPNQPALPAKLADGEQLSWMIPMNTWLENGPQRLIAWPYMFFLRTLYIRAYSSTGEVTSQKIGSDIRKEIKKYLKGKSSESEANRGA